MTFLLKLHEIPIIVIISMSMTMMEWYNDRVTVEKVFLYKGERDLASDSSDSFSQALEAHLLT